MRRFRREPNLGTARYSFSGAMRACVASAKAQPDQTSSRLSILAALALSPRRAKHDSPKAIQGEASSTQGWRGAGRPPRHRHDGAP